MATAWSDVLDAAAAGTAQARYLVVGDSMAEGQGATAKVLRWQEAFLDEIRDRYAIPGASRGIIPKQYYVYGASSSWASAPGINYGGSTTNAGIAGKGIGLTNGAWVEWTGTGTGFTIFYDKWAGIGTYNVTVDGVAVGSITSAAQGIALRWSYTFPTAGTHTVRVTASGGTGNLEGCAFWAGGDGDTKGVLLWDLSHSGAVASSLNPAGDFGVALDIYQPHLVIDEFTGGNEYLGGGATPATVAANLTARLNRYAALPSAPTVLVYLHWRYAAFETVPNSIGHTFKEYRDACRDAAQAAGDNVFIIDLSATIGNADPAWISSDGIHANDTGHAQIAAAMADYLGALSGSKVALGDAFVSAAYLGTSRVKVALADTVLLS